MNDTATDERVLEVAIRLFAEHGYNGTSIRQITRAADANLGAVTYHFGGKRALYGAALERCIGPLAERVRSAASSGGDGQGEGEGEGDPLARLDRVVGLFFDYLRERPELPQLMLQETVAGRQPPAGALKLVRGVLAAIAGLITEAQSAGAVRAGDARLLAVSVVSQPLHLTLTARLVAGVDPDEAESRARLLAHARSFIRQGLARAEGEMPEEEL
jgi:AcrR family transcriptional regulator